MCLEKVNVSSYWSQIISLTLARTVFMSAVVAATEQSAALRSCDVGTRQVSALSHVGI